MEDTDILQSAIVKLRVKIKPDHTQTAVGVPEPHKGLYPLLEIWDEEAQDPETDNKTKFIYDFLTDEQGTARDKIMHIFTELPQISNVKTLDRIYKYCKLRDEYRKTITRAETLNKRMKNL